MRFNSLSRTEVKEVKKWEDLNGNCKAFYFYPEPCIDDDALALEKKAGSAFLGTGIGAAVASLGYFGKAAYELGKVCYDNHNNARDEVPLNQIVVDRGRELPLSSPPPYSAF